MTTAETDPVLDALAAYEAAVFAKDIDAFVALYDADVRVFDLWAVWSHEGQAAWRGMAADWFGSLGAERVRVDFSDVRSTVAGDLAVGHAFTRFTALGADGAPLRSMSNRLTLALRRTPAGWKIVHEHSSAPADHATGKVVLERPA